MSRLGFNIFCTSFRLPVLALVSFLSIPASSIQAETSKMVPESPSATSEQSAESPTSNSTRSSKNLKTRKKSRSHRSRKRPSGIGSTFYLGLFGGWSGTEATLGNEEQERSGYQFAFKTSASIYSGVFGIEAGAGWFHNQLSSKGTFDVDSATLESGDVRLQKNITSSGAFIEFSPFFALDDHTSLGPVATFALAPYKLYLPTEDNKPQTILFGVKGAYEFVKRKAIYRVSAHYMVDINIEPRSIQNFLIGFEYGRPLLQRFTKIVKKTKIRKKRIVVETTVEKKVKKKVLLKNVTIVFDQQMINFVTAKAELLPTAVIKITRLARFLAENQPVWSQVIVEGLTDSRGELNYNMRLSNERAFSVSQALGAGGVDRRRIKSAGFGPTRPLDTRNIELAWARNRRVEIRFDGVTDELKLRNGVARAMSGSQ